TSDKRSPNLEIRNGETGPVGVRFDLRTSVFLRNSSFGFRLSPRPNARPPERESRPPSPGHGRDGVCQASVRKTRAGVTTGLPGKNAGSCGLQPPVQNPRDEGHHDPGQKRDDTSVKDRVADNEWPGTN